MMPYLHMKPITKILAGLSLAFGLVMTVPTTAEVIGMKAPPSKRSDSAVALLVFGIAPIALGGWLLWDGKRRQQLFQSSHLDDVFYTLLLQNAGTISPLGLSMQSGLSGAEAKAFLDDRARQFNANYEATAQGDVVYVFDVSHLPQADRGRRLPGVE
jgi:hypothetical protein